jgi:hypothetical protein
VVKDLVATVKRLSHDRGYVLTFAPADWLNERGQQPKNLFLIPASAGAFLPEKGFTRRYCSDNPSGVGVGPQSFSEPVQAGDQSLA